MKLHLGCANRKIPGYINIDARPEVNPDRVDDVFKLESFEPNSVDVIYICHVLEHVKRKDIAPALARYYELLKEGGILRISVPDMYAVVTHYLYSGNLFDMYNMIWGSQRHDFDYHYCGWDFDLLVDDLSLAGFHAAWRYDWRKTEHAEIDDYSQAYWPHMDKENGKLMSLNVEAVK